MQAMTTIDPTAMVPSDTPTAWSVPELSSKQIKNCVYVIYPKIVEIVQNVLFICCIVHTVTF